MRLEQVRRAAFIISGERWRLRREDARIREHRQMILVSISERAHPADVVRIGEDAQRLETIRATLAKFQR